MSHQPTVESTAAPLLTSRTKTSPELPVPPIPYFSGTEDAKGWIKTFERITAMIGSNDEDRMKRFSCYLQGSALSWYYSRACPTSKNPPKGYTALKNTFLKLFVPSDYADKELEKIFAQCQQTGEPVITFMLDLLGTIEEFDPTLSEERQVTVIRKELIPGINAFLRMVTINSVYELIDHTIPAEQAFYEQLKHFARSRLLENSSNPPANSSNSSPSRLLLKCDYCEKNGHKLEFCYKKQRDEQSRSNFQPSTNQPINQIASPVVEDCSSNKNWGIREIVTMLGQSQHTSRVLTVKITINGAAMTALVDTRASISIIRQSSISNIGIPIEDHQLIRWKTDNLFRWENAK